MSQFRTSRTFDAIFLVILSLGLWWSVIHRVAIGDWIFFLRYSPSSQTTQVASDAGMNDLGRHLFYRTDPTFASKQAVSTACDIEQLGCIDSKGRVYILDEPGQHSQTVVTAAHEMLHLAYRRLSPEDKANLAPLIDQAIELNKTAGLTEELQDEKTSEDIRDEAHSLLGTEYRQLPPALEEYYSRYFTDRSKVVAAQADSQ